MDGTGVTRNKKLKKFSQNFEKVKNRSYICRNFITIFINQIKQSRHERPYY